MPVKSILKAACHGRRRVRRASGGLSSTLSRITVPVREVAVHWTGESIRTPDDLQESAETARLGTTVPSVADNVHVGTTDRSTNTSRCIHEYRDKWGRRGLIHGLLRHVTMSRVVWLIWCASLYFLPVAQTLLRKEPSDSPVVFVPVSRPDCPWLRPRSNPARRVSRAWERIARERHRYRENVALFEMAMCSGREA